LGSGSAEFKRQLTVRFSGTEWLEVPLLPVIVSGYVPRVAPGFAEMVRVEVPLAVAAFGENVALTPEGRLEMLSVTELLAPEAVNVTVKELLDLRLTEIEEGGAEILKSPADAFTVTDSVTECDKLPAVPVTITL
jgi:hypothetical protein